MFPFSKKDYDFFINYIWLLHFFFDIIYCYFLAIFDKAFLICWVHVLWIQFVNSCILPTKCIQYFNDCLTKFFINFATNMFPFIRKIKILSIKCMTFALFAWQKLLLFYSIFDKRILNFCCLWMVVNSFILPTKLTNFFS